MIKRFLIIGLLWVGWVGSAVAGPAVYDYTPEISGMDFSTAPKPHLSAPGGEWHAISGDGTIYPDIINYCDPNTDPVCLGHIYVACHAWLMRKLDETGLHFPHICEEAGQTHYTLPLLMQDRKGHAKGATLFYYKLDAWKIDEMLYHSQQQCELPPIEEIPFGENSTYPANRWDGEYAVDIYFGSCRPHSECLTNGEDWNPLLTEADKNCPLTYCEGYGFQELKEAHYYNDLNGFIYPQTSLAFSASQEILNRYNFASGLLQGSAAWCVSDLPARWLPGHPLSVHGEAQQ